MFDKRLVLVSLLCFAFAVSHEASARRRRHRKPVKPFFIEMAKHPDAAAVTAALATAGMFKILDKDVEAKPNCTEHALANPAQIEIFALNRRKDRVLVLCPGASDAEKNVATLFYPDKPSVRKELSPPKGQARVADRQIQEAFRKVMASGEPSDET